MPLRADGQVSVADDDPDDVTAGYADGILTVTVGVKEAQADQVRKIEITTAK